MDEDEDGEMVEDITRFFSSKNWQNLERVGVKCSDEGDGEIGTSRYHGGFFLPKKGNNRQPMEIVVVQFYFRTLCHSMLPLAARRMRLFSALKRKE